ncbi:MAG TPA: ATP-binding protein [Bacteroidia bacterium]|nr:ATP-binding protein [Bacteroidia bacterium]
MPSTEKDLIFAVFIAATVLFILATLVVLLVYNYFKVKAEKQKAILKAVYDTQEAERTRIAEDLHDDIGAKLSALKLQNELVMAEGLTENGTAYARKNAGLLDQVVGDIRRIVRNQASKYVYENGLLHELTTLVNQYRQLSGFTIELETDDHELPLKNEFKITAFRIIQELLHNAVKHSGASQVKMRIKRSGSTFLISVSDNGKGFDTVGLDGSGMGFKNIRTRTELYDGILETESIPNVKTSFTITFPLKGLLER